MPKWKLSGDFAVFFSFLLIGLIGGQSAPASLELLTLSHEQARLSISANGNSMAPIFTADCSKIFFISQADNLVTNDHNTGHHDIYVWHASNGVIELVTTNASGSSANEASDLPVISADGKIIAFSSRANDFGFPDPDNLADIYWRDLTTGATKWLSASTNISDKHASSYPSMSADGRWIAFESRSENMVTNDHAINVDIYLYDASNDVLKVISTRTTGFTSSTFSDRSINPLVSANGRYAVFSSVVSGLVVNTNNHRSNLYVYDTELQEKKMIKLLSGDHTNTLLSVRAFNHSLSEDGHYLSFQANHTQTNSVKQGIYWMDLETDQLISFEQQWSDLTAAMEPSVTNKIYTHNLVNQPDLSGPSISADGQVMVFEGTYLTNGQRLQNLFVWHPLSGQISRLTNSFSDFITNIDFSPKISRDGRYVVAQSSTIGLFVVDLESGAVKETGILEDFPGAVLSPDGKTLAFHSSKSDLVEGDLNRSYDVFLHDLETGANTLVSRRDPRATSTTGVGWSGEIPRSISDDGRYVAFASTSDSLVTNDFNDGVLDVFVRDLETQKTMLVSVEHTGTRSGNLSSFNPMLSGDGRYVVFESFAKNLTETSGSSGANIFIRDLHLGITQLVSQPPTNNLIGDSFGSAISADGRYVVFQSNVAGLTEDDLSVDPDTFLYEVSSRQTRLISTNLTTRAGSQDPNPAPAISGDGSIVVFQKSASGGFVLFVYDTVSHTYQRVLTNTPNSYLYVSRDGTRVSSTWPISRAINSLNINDGKWTAINSSSTNHSRYDRKRLSTSSDGRYLAYSLGTLITFPPGGRVDYKNSVWVYDFVQETNYPVNVNLQGQLSTNGMSDGVSMSADGRYVAFRSAASDLVEGDDNNASDIFVRDMLLKKTTRVSSGPGPYYHPLISADGRVVVFSSGGNNAALGDFNNSTDAYAVRLTIDNGSTDSDEDGMSDVWEISMFGDLSHDGSGDADQDGLSDLNEFRAGTHPLDDQSTFAGQILTPAGDGSVNISWTITAGKTYRIEYRDSLTEGEWIALADTYAVEGNTATQSDIPPVGTEQRYYRIVIVETP